jgi:hypothetical protein
MKLENHKETTLEIIRLSRSGLSPRAISRTLGMNMDTVASRLKAVRLAPDDMFCGRCWSLMRENGKQTKADVREWLQGRVKWYSGIPGCGPAVFERLKEWAHS